MATRQTSSIGLFALPIIVMGTLHLIITPLGELLALSWLCYALVPHWHRYWSLLTDVHDVQKIIIPRSEIMKKMKMFRC